MVPLDYCEQLHSGCIWTLCEAVPVCLGCVPKTEITGSCGNCMSDFQKPVNFFCKRLTCSTSPLMMHKAPWSATRVLGTKQGFGWPLTR